MGTAVDTKDSHEVERVVDGLYRDIFPGTDPALVNRAFRWARDCFTGKYPGYQAIDAQYHDFEHTLQGVLCLARLLHGRAGAKAEPPVAPHMFELGLLAILFHDTGYLKRTHDVIGTGAKYTMIHVSLSADFAEKFLYEKGLPCSDIAAVRHMIRCTGVNVDLEAIPFQSDAERIVGFSLGTADLLGQMAAPDYVEKLPILYQEFLESSRYNDGRMTPAGTFHSAEDIQLKTPMFWEKYVVPKINRDFLGLYRFLNDPYPDGPNPYLERIEANISRLRRKFANLIVK